MDTAIIDLDAFNHERMRLQSLMDDDPMKAIQEARSLPSDMPVKGLLYASLKAGVLIDAGFCQEQTGYRGRHRPFPQTSV
jgi:hypothetical protein